MTEETLLKLRSNNPKSIFDNKRKYLTINNLWNDNTFKISIDKTTFPVDKLCDCVFLEELVAIYHKGEDKIEFIYSVCDPTDAILKRKFDYNYDGKSFKCYFDTSTIQLEIIAKGFEPLLTPEKSNHRNLREFKDFYSVTKQPTYIKDYFKNKKPFSFFIKGKLGSFKNDFTELIKSINFYFTFYDRESPLLILLQKESLKEEFKTPCYSLFDTFPSVINGRKIEITILDILYTAHKTEDIRLQFIFYFQILEYCSYYYLENSIRQKLFNLLKQPDINVRAVDYSKNIIEDLQDHFSRHKDDAKKMEKTISTFCCIDDIKYEIEENCDFFCKEIEFDGGLKIPKLFNDKNGVNAMTENTLNTIRGNIEKIRNVLVHLRESRENKVILPTNKNDSLLLPYLFVVRRLAEKVAIMYE